MCVSSLTETSARWVVRYMSDSSSRGKYFRYTWNRILRGPQNWSECRGRREESPPHSNAREDLRWPTRSLLTIQTGPSTPLTSHDTHLSNRPCFIQKLEFLTNRITWYGVVYTDITITSHFVLECSVGVKLFFPFLPSFLSFDKNSVIAEVSIACINWGVPFFGSRLQSFTENFLDLLGHRLYSVYSSRLLIS